MVLSGRGVIRRVLGIASRATEIDCSTYPSTYPRYVPQRATYPPSLNGMETEKGAKMKLFTCPCGEEPEDPEFLWERC